MRTFPDIQNKDNWVIITIYLHISAYLDLHLSELIKIKKKMPKTTFNKILSLIYYFDKSRLLFFNLIIKILFKSMLDA